ncbi:MAG: hypothetical protein JWO26_2428 [Rhodospirillales bacterium]|jgi:hypothetical protein|nr:hypothetical protein [Rhodospirillales bacterium]MDB5382796.1 hypothetical protein [Rhodospirillales bacterium]
MTGEAELVWGLSLAEWQAVFRPGMPEFAAHKFVFTSEEPGRLLRIAFGNQGPPVDSQGTRSAIYTHAVTLTPDSAIALAHMLLKHIAQPDDGNRARSSA